MFVIRIWIFFFFVCFFMALKCFSLCNLNIQLSAVCLSIYEMHLTHPLSQSRWGAQDRASGRALLVLALDKQLVSMLLTTLWDETLLTPTPTPTPTHTHTHTLLSPSFFPLQISNPRWIRSTLPLPCTDIFLCPPPSARVHKWHLLRRKFWDA